MRYAGLLIAFGLTLAGCQKDETIAGVTTPDTVWTLTEMNGVAVTATFTIQFEKDGAVFGQADCNRYRTTQRVPLPWIEFAEIAGTRALCPNANLEMEYYTALDAVETAEIAGPTLLMTGPDVTLTFRSDG